MRPPCISVIMSVYNSGKYLSEAIESILNQTYSNIEFIIINDGSKDNSLNIIKEYQSKDSRIVLIDQENKGLTKSLNIGIKVAKGNYIARQDSDDISLPDRFSKFINFLRKNKKIDLYSTPSYTIDEKNTINGVIPNFFRRNGFDQQSLNYYNSMIHGTLIADSNLLRKFLYNEDFRLSQDFELYHRLMSSGYKISYDKDNISYKLRYHNDALSSKNQDKQIQFLKKILISNKKKYYKKNFLSRFYFRIIDILFYIKTKFTRIK